MPDCTACGHRMAHRKWNETKQQPSLLPDPAMPDCSLVSFHILWAILCPQAVLSFPPSVYCMCIQPLVRFRTEVCHFKSNNFDGKLSAAAVGHVLPAFHVARARLRKESPEFGAIDGPKCRESLETACIEKLFPWEACYTFLHISGDQIAAAIYC